MNKVHLLGRICNDIELRQSQSGIASCKFTIAVNRPFKNKQTGEYETDFISCMAWRQTAEFISRYWNKGKMIAVTGSLRTGSYQDKNHPDVKHYTTDVQVDEAYFCGDKSNDAAYPPEQTTPDPAMNYGNLSDFEEIITDPSDVPF